MELTCWEYVEISNMTRFNRIRSMDSFVYVGSQRILLAFS